MKKLLLVVFLAAGTAMAQTGYVASEALLQSVPEFQTAQQEISKLAASLKADDQKAENNVKEKMAELQAKVQELRQTATDEAAFNAELEIYKSQATALENELMNSKKLAELKLGEKQNKLLAPLSQKLNEAIKKVALSRGYKIIVDISAVSYATEDANISKAVALELGIAIPEE
ncbi:OmpH family outer membrane protein [Nonlabens sp.]|uniref:OmpH family outer membrane protein n=1 Tax=Nonlabens sp. TaxID=1888209 RepID=UPI001BCBD79A|nr:OmpH family outer membrane protein [Nonlabens sp.]